MKPLCNPWRGFVKNQIDKVMEDKKVKAVVVRVDSPGGTVSGSDYIFHHLKKLREAGIVGSERQGLWAYYYVIPDSLEEFSAWLS